MQCPRCGAENREGSNFCRYCAEPLRAAGDAVSGYMPTVPPPPVEQPEYGPAVGFEVPPQPPAPRPVVGQRLCPRCNSSSILKGSTPVWAIVLTIVTFPIFCVFSLFFLLIKEPNRCLHCELEFK